MKNDAIAKALLTIYKEIKELKSTIDIMAESIDTLVALYVKENKRSR